MKEIQLTRGMTAIVDDDDFEELSKFKWHVSGSKGRFYACRIEQGKRIEKRTYLFMHRIITKANFGDYVDHINRNSLDNRKLNLRICTQSQNTGNSCKKPSITSIYKGVYFDKARGKYHAHITMNGKVKFLGRFKSEIEAASAYDLAASRYFGKFALVNFPRESEIAVC